MTDHTHAWEKLPNGEVRCFECDAVKPTTPAERKRRQREQDRREGIREVCVRVRAEDAEKVREFVAMLNSVSTSAKDATDQFAKFSAELHRFINSGKSSDEF